MIWHIKTEVNAFSKYFLGITLIDLGRVEDAENHFTKAMNINSQLASVYNYRGRYYYLCG